MRIDLSLKDKFGSRTKAAFAIEKGYVLVNGKRVDSAYNLKATDNVEFIEPEESYVSNGGFKLSKALKDFGYSIEGKIFADIGASTGGFTDCLFKNGAKKVYCIDVGENQLDKSLLNKNIVVIDNFNARNLSKDLFCEVLCGAVIDVSFISLTYILGGVADALEFGADVIALIKPQFECESKKVGKNGIVSDKAQRIKILKKIFDFALSCNLQPLKLTTAPIIKGKNIEYLALFKKSESVIDNKDELIKSALL